MFLDQEAPVVAHLVEAVGNMLLPRFGTILEHQADLRAIERSGVESRCGAGHADPQAVGGEDAVAGVQPQRALLVGAH